MQTDTTDQQTPAQRVEDVAAPLETITRRGCGTRNVFHDWVTLMLTALTGQEERYCEIVQSYPNDGERGDREADLFAEAFGELQSAMADLNRDVLGEVYEHLGLQNHENGQHFTPHSVCKMNAEIILGDDVGSVKDPACGSGRLLMEAGRLAPDAFFAGRDNDRLCAQMAALNMCFFNLDAVIIHGNSIKLTRRAAWRTIQTPLGGEIRPVDPDDLAEFDEAAFGDDTESESASESQTKSENRGERAGDSEEVSLSVSSEQAGLDAFTP